MRWAKSIVSMFVDLIPSFPPAMSTKFDITARSMSPVGLCTRTPWRRISLSSSILSWERG